MNMPIAIPQSLRAATNRRAVRQRLIAAICLGYLLLGGCHKPPPASDAAQPSDAKSDTKSGAAAKPESSAQEGAGEGVVLTSEQVEKMGLATEAARAIEYRDEIMGYGVVVAHETIAQAVAELVTAQATEQQSRAALSRAKRLSGTPGAVSADVEETATRQATVDAAALTLTRQRLAATLGQKPPWRDQDAGTVLQDLAAGRIKLVRVTFPLGTLRGENPPTLRAAHIGTGSPAGWKMNAVWDAPADASVPGRSFFALLKNSDAGEGERLQVWASVGTAVSGVIIPSAAAVMSEGKYWCYVEKKPLTFVRTEIDTGRATPDGYFVAEGVAAGDKVVTSAAGQLLAKESNSGSEPN
jgi:hypothetical protein